MRLILFLFFALLMGIGSNLSAQNKLPYPMVGDPFPDHTFYDLDNYPTKSAKISDFRGKWLLLDMWGYSCSACIASFRKMDHLSQTFEDSLKIILVGATKSRVQELSTRIEKITKDRYFYLKANNNLTITTAFDSVLYIKHDVGSLPHIFVIDPAGVLRAKAVSVDSLQLAELIHGGHPKFERSYSNSEKSASDSYNRNLPFLTSGTEVNGGIDTSFLYRSLLSYSTEKTSFGIYRLLRPQPNSLIENGRLEVFNLDLKNLLQIAFLGTNDQDELTNSKIYPNLVYHGKDSIGFRNIQKKAFSYSLTVPKTIAKVSVLMENMQQDLSRYFGYSTKLDICNVPVYSLVVIDKTKANHFVQSKSTLPGDYLKKITVQNDKMDQFITGLSFRLHLDKPLFNDTGLEGPVNISFEANMLNPIDVKSQLGKQGLQIIETEKPMRAIIVNDK